MKNSFFIALSLLLALASNAQSHSAHAINYGSNKQVGKYLSTRGFKMYYETYGSGEPLLIIHGNGDSIGRFKYQIPFFDKHYKVILADSRAQGKSHDASDSLSYEMMTDDLNALLDSLHLDSCFVLGWSDGGIEGLMLAYMHPDKVKKLAVTGANLTPDTSAVDLFIYNWGLAYNDSLQKIPQTSAVKNERKLAYLLSNEPHISLESLHKIKCPTLAIGGDHDVLLPKHTMLIADNIEKSYLWIVPNSGHGTPVYSHRDMFNEVVYDFFQQPYRKIESFEKFH